jgi:hypothetical protein
MANEFLVNRVAFGTFSFPSNLDANTASTLSVNVDGVYIPTGAIITGIKYVPVGALTNMSAMKDGTINLKVGTQALGTADAKASLALLAGSVYNHTVVAAGIAAAPIVSTGGQLWVNFASSDSARTAVAANVGVYVGYLASI